MFVNMYMYVLTEVGHSFYAALLLTLEVTYHSILFVLSFFSPSCYTVTRKVV